MHKFFDPLDVRKGPKLKWTLLKHFVFISDYAGQIVVPAGFETDLLSIPKPFRQHIDMVHGAEAAVIHDFLYYSQHIKNRKLCDKILLEGLLELNISKIKAYIIYFGVRVGGWWGWNKRAKNKITHS